MDKYKIGDKVRCVYNDNGSGRFIGKIGRITYVGDSSSHPYAIDFAPGYSFGKNEIELYDKKTNNMNITSKLAIIFKGEPQKSFIKAGIIDTSEIPTDDGIKLLVAYIIKNDLAGIATGFKKDVVDPINDENNKE